MRSAGPSFALHRPLVVAAALALPLPAPGAEPAAPPAAAAPTADELAAALAAAKEAKAAAEAAQAAAEAAQAKAEEALAKAQATAEAGAKHEEVAKKKFEVLDWVKFGGTYQIWGLNQHGFLLGKDHPLDDADYVVQMLRGNLRVGNDDYGVKTRFDAAQGWWGVDNEPDNEPAYTLDPDGNLVSSTVYNPYALFRNKDTNYTIHFDHAFLYVKLPKIPVFVTAGRQPYQLGHQLVLDHDLDGVKVLAKPHEKVDIELFWAAVSEGANSYRVPFGTLMSDKDGNADANLFGGTVTARLAPTTLTVFAAGLIDDTGTGDATFLPNGVGYLDARFRPNLTKVVATGLTLDGKVDLLDGLSWETELDYLWGQDEVANTTHAGGLLDINDGTLWGLNAYLRVRQQALVKKVGLHVGAAFGFGTGDDDPTKGHGNINKIQTAGFFPWTNVWEDSVMPDIGGISPQGLGSPVSRGYREFENTTTVLVHGGVTPIPALSFDVAYAYMRATQPVYAFDATGTPLTATSHELGHEIDVNGSWKIWKNVKYELLFGYFFPGQGAGFLVNGTDATLRPAWEVKQVASVVF